MTEVPWRRRRRQDTTEADVPAWQRSRAVIDEACALLAGRAAEAFLAEGKPVPNWAWLNSLAHQSPDAVLALGLHCSGDIWADAAMAVARALGSAAPLAIEQVRSEILVPAQLDALSGAPRPPDSVVREVRRALVASHASALEQAPRPGRLQ